MGKLRQLVIGAADPLRLAHFYREVFELDTVEQNDSALSLSDGIFHLALLRESEPSKQGLRLMGFDTVRVDSLGKKLAQFEMSPAAVRPVQTQTGVEFELNDPDGNVVGICRRAFDVAYEESPVPIRHIALYTPNPQRLSDFYCRVFDMKEVDRTDRSSIFVSDGYLNLALLYQRREEPVGLNHFGFHVKSNDEVQTRAEKAGVLRGAARPDRIPFAEYRVHDPEGNGIDISQKGWRS